MEDLTPEEVKLLIKASKIAKAKGITRGASVKEICDKAGISRKTGYQWVNEEDISVTKNEDAIEKLSHLRIEQQKILNKYKESLIENEGLHLAIEIHGLEDVLKKKGISIKNKKRKP